MNKELTGNLRGWSDTA